MVSRRRAPGRARRSQAVEDGRTQIRARSNWDEDLFRLDAQHPALVHLAPALVGPPDSGLVRRRRQSLRRRDRSGRAARARAKRHGGERFADPRRGCARHLVLVGAVAVLDTGLAGRNARTRALLSHRRAGHRLRHHLLLGCPDDDDGPAFHGRRAVPHGVHPHPGAGRARARKCPRPRAMSSTRWP